jgi:putative colanic acid biosynthesis UDP-glucose lipid carrier transferase
MIEVLLTKTDNELLPDMDNGKQHLDISLPVTGEVKLDRLPNRIIKRSMDLVLGSALMLISFPIIVPLVAIIIRLDSKGPIFFLQKRTGLHGKSFVCFKFRTMKVNKDADKLQVQPNDSRITRPGKLLRKYYIDELPQLVNVVWGNMSLVGPRPLMLRHTVVYSRIVKNYHERHLVKPGMTGLAQMRGYHGTIHNKQELYTRCMADVEYIRNWSLFGDLYIFIGTLLQVVKKLLW